MIIILQATWIIPPVIGEMTSFELSNNYLSGSIPFQSVSSELLTLHLRVYRISFHAVWKVTRSNQNILDRELTIWNDPFGIGPARKSHFITTFRRQAYRDFS